MIKLLWILPNLNEKKEVVKNNLLKCFNYARKRGYESKIILSDGGSNWKYLCELKKFVEKLQNKLISTHLLLCFPAVRPNKNLSILNVVEKYSADYVLILDSDLLSLNERCFDNLINPLVSGNAKMVLPNIPRKTGRSNYLIINPLLRLFYPKVAQFFNFPLSGILGINYRLLYEIVTAKDYCWDWGGEIQIICRGFEKTQGLVKAFVHRRRDAKRRPLVSKMKEARQFFRTLLYEIRRKDDFVSVIERVKNSWQSNKVLYQKFLNYQKKLKISIVPDIKNLEDYFNQVLKLCDRNLDWFSFYLEKVYHQTNAVEFLLLKNVTVDTILKVLFNFNHKVYLKEKNKFKKLENVDLESISIFADLIFGVYLTLGKGKIKRMKNLQEFLNLLSPKDTDFIDQIVLNNFRKLGLISLNLNDLHSNKLKKILQIYNNSKLSVLEKNRLILKIIKTK